MRKEYKTYKVLNRIFDNGYLYGYELWDNDDKQYLIVDKYKLKFMLKLEPNMITNASLKGNQIQIDGIPKNNTVKYASFYSYMPKDGLYFKNKLEKGINRKFGELFKELNMYLYIQTMYAQNGRIDYKLYFTDKDWRLVKIEQSVTDLSVRYPWLFLNAKYTKIGANSIEFKTSEQYKSYLGFVSRQSEYISKYGENKGKNLKICYKTIEIPSKGRIESYYRKQSDGSREDLIYMQGYYLMDLELRDEELTDKKISEIINNISIH